MRKLKVGDIVEVLDGHKGDLWVPPMRIHIGKKYRITDFKDYEPNNRIVRFEESEWNFEEKYLRLVDKYKEVKEDKEAKNPEKIEIGDLVEVLDGKEGEVWASGMNQYIGDKLVVDRFVGTDNNIVHLKGSPYYFEAKYVRLVKKGKTAPLAEEKKEEKQENFNIGDFVLILDGRDDGAKEPGWVDEMDNLIGQIGVVCRKNCDNAIRVKACGEDWNYATNWIRKINPKEYFQEGDKVVILNGKNDPVNYSALGMTADHWVDGMDQTIGQIGTIKILGSGCCNVALPDGDHWWYNYPWVRKATEEEIAAGTVAKNAKEEPKDDAEDEDKTDTRSFIDIIKEELGAKSDKEPAPSTETSDSEGLFNDAILEMVDVMACSSMNTKNIIDTLEKALTVFRKETPDSKEYRDAMHSLLTIGKAYSVALEAASKFAQSISEITDRVLKSVSDK